MTRDAERSQAHVWRFFRAGGFDQVRLDNSGDIAAVPTLDQKLWVALACATRGIEFDERTLDLIDTEPEGKEILASAHAMLGVVGKADAAEISMQDPYAEKPSRGPYYLGAVLLALGLLAAAWRYGWLAPWLTP
jgi:hypothetical protein